MTVRKKLKALGLDYHKLAEFFGYQSPTAFSSSSARKRTEEGVLKCIEFIKENDTINVRSRRG